MESYKEELFINETSHRFLSPPCSADPFSKWVASYELIQCSYYFKKDYVFLLCAIARLRERERMKATSLPMCQNILQPKTIV